MSKPAKIPPHSVEAEESVLGTLLIDNRTWDIISDYLQEHDFYRPENRLIFSAISRLAMGAMPFDVITIGETLKTQNVIEKVGGESYLYDLADRVPSIANIEAYANIVQKCSVRRQLIAAAGEVADMAFNPEHESSESLLDTAESKIFAIAEQRSRQEPQRIDTVMAKAYGRLSELSATKAGPSGFKITGLSTGFIDLDRMTSGFQKGDLIIVAARPSMGKTAFAMNIAEDVLLKSKKPVLVFSMEMSAEQLALRLISSLSRTNQHNLRSADLKQNDWHRINSVIKQFSEIPLYLEDSPGLNPTELRSRTRRLIRSCGEIGLVVVDYLQLMQMTGFKENRTIEIAKISRSLKSLARELDIPIVVLSQLNRSLEQRGDRRPIMSDLRESGAIEQDADLIVFIYRDEIYNKESPEKGVAEIIIAKQRNGPVGRVKLKFFGEYTRFSNLTEADPVYITSNSLNSFTSD